ncbi:TRAF-like family protein [Perilla frutescens var. frutescens]|nr:TRAF-like family protein [Perilla frutescens var. frutescens]
MVSKTSKGGSSKKKKPQAKFDKKTKSKSDLKEKKPEEVQAASPKSIAKQDAELRRRLLLAEDGKNPALDVGPDGRPGNLVLASEDDQDALTIDPDELIDSDDSDGLSGDEENIFRNLLSRAGFQPYLWI